VDRLSAWAAGSSCTDCRRGLLGWTAWRPAGHVIARDGNSVWIPDTRRVSDLTDMDMEMIFYLCVTPVSDSNQDGYGMSIFFYPRVTRRVPDTLLPL
jgi:hypothetical protein